MERLKPMLTARSDFGWSISNPFVKSIEQVCQLSAEMA
jgi:hypothetical protein